MDILVLDKETSLHNVGESKVGNFKADPFHPDNWVVWLGVKWLRDDLSTRRKTQLFRFKSKTEVAIPAPRVRDKLLLVGHNIKFDLEYACAPNNKHAADWRALLNDPRVLIWDTMQAEFRLRGQAQIQPSMDWCCERRGWEVKPGRLKEYWNNGISTEDIPDEEVEPYLTHDVDTTADLFKDQVAEAIERGMMPLLRMEMDAIAATCVMEVNGMHFDKMRALTKLEEELQPKLDALYSEIAEQFATELDVPVEVINPNSNPFLSAYIYGGPWKYRLQQPMYEEDGVTPVVFKSGKRKGEHKKKWVDYEVELPRKVPRTCRLQGSDEETLGKLKKYLDPVTGELFDKLLSLREQTKTAKTYYSGYSKLTWGDNKIHGNLNHAIVATARLSSSAPNLQNAAHTDIRECFVSRYDNGHLMEVDLSQIEVVVQAFLSQDEQLIADIKAGVDFHSKRAAAAAGEDYETVRQAYLNEDPYWTKQRKKAKVFSFQRAYGAGAPLIAATTGMPIAEVEALIKAEEEMYPGVVQYQADCIVSVNRSTAVRDGVTCGALTTATGSEYRFLREKHRGEWAYKPTTIKNYPVQGMAGDIIKLILGSVRGWLYEWNKANAHQRDPVLLIMTVHDSVIFDVPAWVDTRLLAAELVALFKSAPDMLKSRFGIDFNVPISADADVGENWFHHDEETNPQGMRSAA